MVLAGLRYEPLAGVAFVREVIRRIYVIETNGVHAHSGHLRQVALPDRCEPAVLRRRRLVVGVCVAVKVVRVVARREVLVIDKRCVNAAKASLDA